MITGSHKITIQWQIDYKGRSWLKQTKYGPGGYGGY